MKGRLGYEKIKKMDRSYLLDRNASDGFFRV
jgi:hypothetical protein